MRGYYKNTVLLLFILIGIQAMSQSFLKFPTEEHAILKTVSNYSFNDTNINFKGLNYGAEFGYSGKIYTLIGFEKFSSLKGELIDGEQSVGYLDFHGTIGINLCSGIWSEHNYNLGFRMIRVYRGLISENRYRNLIGFEAGYTYDLTNQIGIGIRTTYDYRSDLEIFELNPEWKGNAFVTLTYKIKGLGRTKI